MTAEKEKIETYSVARIFRDFDTDSEVEFIDIKVLELLVSRLKEKLLSGFSEKKHKEWIIKVIDEVFKG